MEAVGSSANHLNDDHLKPESVIHSRLLPIPQGLRESSVSYLNKPMNKFEYTAMKRIFRKAMAKMKQDDNVGKYTTIMRKHANLMMEELGKDFDIEMAQEQCKLCDERQAEANLQLLNLADEI
jgi:hypothetical protein